MPVSFSHIVILETGCDWLSKDKKTERYPHNPTTLQCVGDIVTDTGPQSG